MTASLHDLEIEVPEQIAAEAPFVRDLPEDWRADTQISRTVGDEWLRSGGSALLRVPSVIVPMTWNTLINPAHPDVRHIRIVRTHEHGIDPRLL